MPRLKAMSAKMAEMQGALAEQDWEQLLTLDAEFAALLTGHAWNEQEQSALQNVRNAYATMQEACRLATKELADKLAQFAEQRDASLAYAAQTL
jgi:DNA-binding GntR family transcriptional regulator